MDYNRYMDAFPHMREMMIWHTPYYPPFFLYLVYYVLPWIILTALSSFTFLRLSTRQKETPEHLSTNQNITERISIYVALVSILMLKVVLQYLVVLVVMRHQQVLLYKVKEQQYMLYHLQVAQCQLVVVH